MTRRQVPAMILPLMMRLNSTKEDIAYQFELIENSATSALFFLSTENDLQGHNNTCFKNSDT